MTLFRPHIASAYVTFALLTYIPDYGWWPSLGGTALMIWICRHWLGDDWRKRLGLSGVSGEWLRSAYLFFVLLLTFALYGKFILEENALRYYSNYEIGISAYYLHTCAQVFNEEIALGAIPLLCTTQTLNVRIRIILGLVLALFFPLLHLLLFEWSPFVTGTQVPLSGLSLLSMFFVAVIGNSLILRRNHLGFTIALHLAWNILFAGGIVSGDRGALNETELFNLTIGNPIAVAALGTVSVVEVWIHAVRWKVENKPNL